MESSIHDVQQTHSLHHDLKHLQDKIKLLYRLISNSHTNHRKDKLKAERKFRLHNLINRLGLVIIVFAIQQPKVSHGYLDYAYIEHQFLIKLYLNR